MKVSQTNNISFKAQFALVGITEKTLKKNPNFVDGVEHLLINDGKNDVLILASEEDAKALRDFKSLKNPQGWVKNIVDLGNKNPLSDIFKFIFGTDKKGIVMEPAFSGEDPIYPYYPNQTKLVDGTTIHTSPKGKIITKELPDGTKEYYDEKGKLKKIVYKDGTEQVNIYDHKGKNLLFSHMPNGEVISPKGIVNYENMTVMFKEEDGSLKKYDFDGHMLSVGDSGMETPDYITGNLYL